MARRLAQCKLELHPEKTKIVYCKDVDRKGDYPKESFDFLGFEFRPRGAKSRLGRYFVGFLPAVSKKAAKSIRSVIRGWLYSQPHNDQGGSLLNGHCWSPIAFHSHRAAAARRSNLEKT